MEGFEMQGYFNSGQLIDGAVRQLLTEPAVFREDSESRGLPANWKRFVADIGEGIEIVIGTMQFAGQREANISLIDRRSKRCQVCLFHDEGQMTAVDVIRGVTAEPISLAEEPEAIFNAIYERALHQFNQPFRFDAHALLQQPQTLAMAG
jgi:hypothetical protein